MAYLFRKRRPEMDPPPPAATEGGPARRLSSDDSPATPAPPRLTPQDPAAQAPFPRSLAEAIRLRRPRDGA